VSSAGRRGTRVQVLEPVTTTDGQGGQTVAWSIREELWAELVALTTREMLQAGALQVNIPVLARIPFRSTLPVTARVKDVESGKSYEVLSSRDPDSKRVTLELELAEVTA
jgi:SPP1 family predicted phage head-tail adaptor